MDPTGFGLAIIAETRTLVTSIKNRIENYRSGPAIFQSLCDNVDRLGRHIAEVERLLRTFPDAVPLNIALVFDETFGSVRNSLQDANRTMDNSLLKAFAASGSSAMDKLGTKARRKFRASALNSSMLAAGASIEKASNQLLQLTLALGSSLKIQQHHDALLSKFENLAVVEPANDVYRPGTNTPGLAATVNLDFISQDEDGRPTTPEGTLKSSVLSSNSSNTVIVAAGVIQPACCIVGMAGVGKTVALQGLAHDEDVQRRFPDGIFFMTLGKGATVETVLREIARIVAVTGAKSIMSTVLSSASVREAVDYAVPWLTGRICLFLVGDIWPTENCKTGFLMDLHQLLRERPESRMAISTRNVAIAQSAGAIVIFGARDSLGPVSLSIFMSHATCSADGKSGAPHRRNLRSSLKKILVVCGGLPIALAVTGCAVRFLASAHGDFDRACDIYSVHLDGKRRGLGDEETMEGTSLTPGSFSVWSIWNLNCRN